MSTRVSRYNELGDDDLVERVNALAARERCATAELIASLAELDARRLYLGAGCSSLFTYCTQVLHLSEHAAYGRIEAARLARRFPLVLERLDAGELTLTAMCLLASVLTDVNHREVLDAARHKSKREVEQLVARLRPQPPVPTTVRKLPVSAIDSASMLADVPGPPPSAAVRQQAVNSAPPPRRPVIAALAPELYKVQFTLSAAGHEKLRRARDLLRHVVPNGDAAAIFERALTLLVEDLERKKLAATERPRGAREARRDTRHIPAAVRREVWKRDDGQCAFVGTSGRCAERGLLEFHHVVPFADGGGASAANIQLRCAAHNRYEAELWFGGGEVRERAPAYA